MHLLWKSCTTQSSVLKQWHLDRILSKYWGVGGGVWFLVTQWEKEEHEPFNFKYHLMLSACDNRTLSQSSAEALPAPFPLSRSGLLTSCCVCPLLSLGAQGQAYTDENHPTQSEWPWKTKHVLLKAQRPHYGCFREAYCTSAQGCAHTPSVCWQVKNIMFSFTWEDPSLFCGFLLQTGGGYGQENHPSFPCALTHRADVSPCPKGISHSHGALWLLCRNWGVLTLQELAPSPAEEGSESNRIPGSAASPMQGNLCWCDVCAPQTWKEAMVRPLLQGLLHTGEVTRVAAERTGMFIRKTQSVWFEHELCSAALLFLSLQCSHTGPWLQNTDV